MKKRDWIAAIIIAGAALGIGLISRITSKNPQSLIIKVDGEVYGEYSLEEDKEIQIGDTNVCIVENRKVRMTEADCPDQICVHTAEISSDGETIVCLPNRIVLEIQGSESQQEQIDSISS